MKYMIASDLHGSAKYTEMLVKAYKEENAGKLILLGDLLYHGPRNDLPEGYEVRRVTELLNALKNEILCVRGNCDAEVDQAVLDFPIMADYALLPLGDKTIFLTHGHIYNENRLPPVRFDILLHGHTHVSSLAEHIGYVYMNPGSVTIPRNGTPHSYMTLENGLFVWKTLDGQEYRRYQA